MKRSIIVLPLVMISLLISCRETRHLRSDIKEFIASFSLNEARKQYLEAGYTREDISQENNQTVRNIETLSFNIKDLDNIAFDYVVTRYVDNVLDEEHSKHNYVYKELGEYYYTNGTSSTRVSAERIVTNYVSTFFYRNEVQNVHSNGMYSGDTIKNLIYDLQKYVTIDQEYELFIYDVPWGVKKDVEGYDFSEHWVVNKLGMTDSCYIKQSNGIVIMETTISVYNIKQLLLINNRVIDFAF